MLNDRLHVRLLHSTFTIQHSTFLVISLYALLALRLIAGILDMLREGRRREAYQTIAEACRAAGVEVSEVLRRGIEEC